MLWHWSKDCSTVLRPPGSVSSGSKKSAKIMENPAKKINQNQNIYFLKRKFNFSSTNINSLLIKKNIFSFLMKHYILCWFFLKLVFFVIHETDPRIRIRTKIRIKIKLFRSTVVRRKMELKTTEHYFEVMKVTTEPGVIDHLLSFRPSNVANRACMLWNIYQR